MGCIRPGFAISFLSLLLVSTGPLTAQGKHATTLVATDSDHDGLEDRLEQALLLQFAPTFMVAEHDCSNLPARFEMGVKEPVGAVENGTVYGQVFPLRGTAEQGLRAEIHYYHLWRKDCGGHGHPLDTEHVAVLVLGSGRGLGAATWKAVYWYAAAHENTVCDVSQIARASTLEAENHGATVWVSPGKHASYFSPDLCHGGCGADRCEKMIRLSSAGIVNLGEPGSPMNGSLFIESSAWPLGLKMAATNFPASTLSRVDQLPPMTLPGLTQGGIRHKE